MTPEELQKTIEFIIQSQARLAAAQEQDRQERVRFDQRLAAVVETQTRLLAIQSQRMDDYEKQQRAFQQQFLELMDDLRASRQEFRIEAEAIRKEAQEARREARREAQEARKEAQEARKESQRWHDEAQKWHEETVTWLKRILDKITDRLN